MDKTTRINTQSSKNIPMTYEATEVRLMWDKLLSEVPVGTKLIKSIELFDTYYGTRKGAAEFANVTRKVAGYAPTLRACKALEKYLEKHVRTKTNK